MTTKQLDARERRFVEEYLIDLDPNAAAIRAGYAKTTAHSKSYDWVCESGTKPHVFAVITEAQAARSERTEIDADWVLIRLTHEATADLADLYGVDGGLKPIAEWPLIWRQGLVSGLDVDETVEDGKKKGQVTKVKLSDRIRRIELIGKHVDVQAFAERHELTGKDGGPVEVKDLGTMEAARLILATLREAAENKQTTTDA